METDKARLVARERLWETRAGLAAIAGAIVALVGFFLLQSSLGGDTNFEGLEDAHESASTIWLSGVVTAIGYFLLAGPLLFLFRAAQGRSAKVKNQFVGLVFLGPLLIGASGLLLAAGTQEAANAYLDGKAESKPVKEVKEECAEDRKESAADFAGDYESGAGSTPLVRCISQKQEEERASNAIRDSSLVSFGRFVGLAGGLSLVIALFYTCLWSLRTGLLNRFWGSLGMAVGVAALIGLTPLALVWFLYLGILLTGILPGGKPPAWEAGEAIPWPTPGEKAAAEMAEDGGGSEPAVPGEGGGEDTPDPPQDPPRKRKQRD